MFVDELESVYNILASWSCTWWGWTLRTEIGIWNMVLFNLCTVQVHPCLTPRAFNHWSSSKRSTTETGHQIPRIIICNRKNRWLVTIIIIFMLVWFRHLTNNENYLTRGRSRLRFHIAGKFIWGAKNFHGWLGCHRNVYPMLLQDIMSARMVKWRVRHGQLWRLLLSSSWWPIQLQ